jgi:hypothetical protein
MSKPAGHPNGRVPTPGIGVVADSEAVNARLGVEGIIIMRTMAGLPGERAGLRGVDLKVEKFISRSNVTHVAD